MKPLTEDQKILLKQRLDELVSEQTINNQGWIKRLRQFRQSTILCEDDSEDYQRRLSPISELNQCPEQKEFVQCVINLALFLLSCLSPFMVMQELFGDEELDLNSGELFEKLLHVDFDIRQAFYEVFRSSQIKTLSLSSRDLGKINTEHWQEFCEALQSSPVKTLKLSGNCLGKMNTEQWKAFCEALRSSQVRTLNLSLNYLGEMNAGKWQAFCGVIQNSQVETLNLSNNNLSKMDAGKWQTFCGALKQSRVTSIDVSNNSLSRERKDQIKSIIQRNLGRESLKGLIAFTLWKDNRLPEVQQKSDRGEISPDVLSAVLRMSQVCLV